MVREDEGVGKEDEENLGAEVAEEGLLGDKMFDEGFFEGDLFSVDFCLFKLKAV